MSNLKLMAFFAVLAFSIIEQNAAELTGNMMTANMTLRDGDKLFSSKGIFAFGFYSLEENSTNRYLGIGYNISVQTLIWVANRVVPVDSNSAVLNLSENGALVLFDETDHKVVWSINISNATDPVLKLFDNGNLVLAADNGENVIWQSFDYPTDTIVPEMKIGVNLRYKLDRRLTPWKNSTDPSPGDYFYMFETRGVPETFIWKGSTKINRYYGPWDADACVHSNNIFSIAFVWNKSEIYYYPLIIDKSLLGRAVLNSNGVLQGFFWSSSVNRWTFFGQFPEDKCDMYAACGPNGVCNPFSTVCQCLKGFVPRSAENWGLKKYSDGCVSEEVSDCYSDEFVLLPNMKLPDTLNATSSSNKSLDECRSLCLQNCSCSAYAIVGVLGCLTWYGDLIDIRVPRAEGDDFFVRIPYLQSDSTGGSGKKKFQIIIVLISVFGGLVLCIGLILYLKRRRKKNQQDKPKTSYFAKEDELELPIFDVLAIRAATNNFSEDNILGKGGFGPVYKGRSEDGREIAIKRLFKGSVQGLNEFKTEALLIAKLQHRNLVRLIGCCIHEDERMLIYEYMPNTSLDAFIFDKKNKMLLNWQKRLDIIRGIARGLLYLHQDSRLRIIHRDLKPSNVLLDEEMSPKISDFGMARIFGADQIHQYTRKIVGTYGYMAPEYAMDGIFSEKSDVYSFGVIILEILSGKKVTKQDEKQTFLLAQAWNLWKEDKCLDFFDKLDEPRGLLSKLMQSVQIGLLCVQEKSRDRPTMEEVILMLDDESIALHLPTPPAFCMETSSTDASDYTSSNDITITAVEGR